MKSEICLSVFFIILFNLSLASAKKKNIEVKQEEPTYIVIPISKSELVFQEDKKQKLNFEKSIEFKLISQNFETIPVKNNNSINLKPEGFEYGAYSVAKLSHSLSEVIGASVQQVNSESVSASQFKFQSGSQKGRIISASLGLNQDFTDQLNLQKLHPTLQIDLKPIWLSIDESAISNSSSQFGILLEPSIGLSYESFFINKKTISLGLQAGASVGQMDHSKMNGWRAGLFIQTDWGTL